MASGKDIQTVEDIKLMVDTFYEKVNQDKELLSPVFNDYARVNWETHLPRMYAFWNNVLFGVGGYKGNPFQKHIPLPIDGRHFEAWIELFVENVDEHFAGPVAQDAKVRARSIAHIFQSKLELIKS